MKTNVMGQMTGDEMREAIQTMMLNRIDELQAEINATTQFNKFRLRLERLHEAELVFATCTDPRWFEPRRKPAPSEAPDDRLDDRTNANYPQGD